MKNKMIVAGLVILSFTALAFMVGSKGNSKIAFLELTSVYNDFTLTKELETKFKNVESARKKILDSLELRLNQLNNVLRMQGEIKPGNPDLNEFELLRQEYLLKQKQFSEENEAMQKQYTNQIWTQLNQYVKEYGEQKGYEYIFGADGSGVLMYGEKANNITEDVKGFVNNKYTGKQ